MVSAVPENDGPPRHLQSVAAEQQVLGSLLIEPALFTQIATLIGAEDFSRPDHRLIFEAIRKLVHAGRPCNVGALSEYLDQAGKLPDAGGLAYIGQLAHDTVTVATAIGSAQLVRERALFRQLARIGSRIERSVLEGAGEEISQLIERAGESIAELQDRAAHADRPRRAPINWRLLEQRQPAVRPWHISHWLTAGPTLLAGAGGVGKTMIAQTIATALALGRRFIDDIHEPMSVLIWACEDDHDELWRRQLAICRYFGVSLAELEGRLLIEPRLGRENTLFDLAYGSPTWTPLRRELAAQINDYRARVLFIDNIGQTYGGRENDRHHVTTFLNGLMGLTADSGFSVVVMGHPSKSADSEFSGSTAWENGVRMRWYMGYQLPDQRGEEGLEEDPAVRYLAKRKANYSEKDYRKLTFRDGLFIPEQSQGDFSQRYGYANRMDGATDCVLHALGRIADAGIRVTDGRTSPDYLPKKMREMKLADDYTPKELGQALAQLRLAGRIREGIVGHYENRSPKRGLVLA